MDTYDHDYPQTEQDDQFLEPSGTFPHEDYSDHDQALPGFASTDPSGDPSETVSELVHNDAEVSHEMASIPEENAYAAGVSAGEALAMGNGRSFGENYKACMATMGMPAPGELFGTYEKALASAALIAVAAEKFGSAVTIAELVGAGLLSEVFLAIGACGAAAYLGVSAGCVITAGSDTVIG